MFTDDSPIFLQLADRVAEDIMNGTYPEDTSVPSTNEYASFYGISPITAAKGMNVLVEQGLLYKRRGVGMFVTQGAPAQLRSERRAAFREQHITPLLREAALLGIAPQELSEMIDQKESS